MSGKGQEVFGLVAIDVFIFSGFPFMYPPSLFYILIFPSISFLGTGLPHVSSGCFKSDDLARTLVPLLLRKADRLQRGPPKDWRRCGSYVCERIG